MNALLLAIAVCGADVSNTNVVILLSRERNVHTGAMRFMTWRRVPGRVYRWQELKPDGKWHMTSKTRHTQLDAAVALIEKHFSKLPSKHVVIDARAGKPRIITVESPAKWLEENKTKLGR